MARFRADPRPHKIDLGVGVYRDENGAVPIMGAVREAELWLAAHGDSKGYQALAGDHAFIEAMKSLILGDGHPAVREGRLAAIQGTGGTGSLRVAMDLAKLAHPEARLHLGLPSWPNHQALAIAAGLQLVTHRYVDVASQAIDHDAILGAAAAARAGDLFVLHGPCHNPTGADLSREQRLELFRMLPLTPDQTEALGRDHAIHMPQSGRINIAGLKSGDAPHLAEALAAVHPN
jgi:aromatic-amino-acid transaminase